MKKVPTSEDKRKKKIKEVPTSAVRRKRKIKEVPTSAVKRKRKIKEVEGFVTWDKISNKFFLSSPTKEENQLNHYEPLRIQLERENADNQGCIKQRIINSEIRNIHHVRWISLFLVYSFLFFCINSVM